MNLAAQTVIFLYLQENETSLLVLVPSGIGLVIQAWKLCKASGFELTASRYGIPSFQFKISSKNSKTSEADATAMKYLNMVSMHYIYICERG